MLLSRKASCPSINRSLFKCRFFPACRHLPERQIFDSINFGLKDLTFGNGLCQCFLVAVKGLPKHHWLWESLCAFFPKFSSLDASKDLKLELPGTMMYSPAEFFWNNRLIICVLNNLPPFFEACWYIWTMESGTWPFSSIWANLRALP